MLKRKNKPRFISKSLEISGVTFTVTLWGYTRKRVFIGRQYYEQVGGQEGWETRRIYDKTFETEEEAKATANDFYLNPEKILKLSK